MLFMLTCELSWVIEEAVSESNLLPIFCISNEFQKVVAHISVDNHYSYWEKILVHATNFKVKTLMYSCYDV